MHVDESNSDSSPVGEDLDLGQSPAFFIVHLRGEDAPSPADIRARIGELEPETEDVSLDDAPAAEEFGGIWQFAVLPPGFPMPMLLRLEPAPAMDGAEGLPVALDDVRWVLVVEAWLDPVDPVDTYGRLAQLLSKLVPDSPALLDLDSGTWYPLDMRRHLFLDLPLEAIPADLLYTLRVVASNGSEDEDEDENAEAGESVSAHGGWLLTAGLARCGLPELEMFGVPEDRLDIAAALMDAMAGMLLGEDAPEPGESMIVSDDHQVSFRVLDEVLDRLAPDAPGSRSMRLETGEQWRLAVCGTDEASMYGPPMALLDALAEGEAGLYLPDEVLDRKMVGAHARWPEVVSAFAEHASASASDAGAAYAGFFAKVRIDGEHHWSRIVAIKDSGLDVELPDFDSEVDGDSVSAIEGAPVSVHHCAKGDLSDWRIVTAEGDVFEAPVTLGLSEALAESKRGRRA